MEKALSEYIKILENTVLGYKYPNNLTVNRQQLYDIINQLNIIEAIQLACGRKSFEIVKFIFDNFKLTTDELNRAFPSSCSWGNMEVINMFIDKGVDVQYGNNMSLQYASREGHIEVADFLLKRGANVNGTDNYDDRLNYGGPLGEGASSNNNNFEIVKFLVEAGANVDTFSDAAVPALNRYHFRTVDYLLQKGAMTSDIMSGPRSVNNDVNIYEYLISRGLNLNKYGDKIIEYISEHLTVRLEAIKRGNSKIVLDKIQKEIKDYQEYMQSDLYKQVMESSLTELKEALGIDLFRNRIVWNEEYKLNTYRDKLIEEYRRIQLLNVEDLNLYNQVMFESSYEDLMHVLGKKPDPNYQIETGEKILQKTIDEVIEKYRELRIL